MRVGVSVGVDVGVDVGVIVGVGSGQCSTSTLAGFTEYASINRLFTPVGAPAASIDSRNPFIPATIELALFISSVVGCPDGAAKILTSVQSAPHAPATDSALLPGALV